MRGRVFTALRNSGARLSPGTLVKFVKNLHTELKQDALVNLVLDSLRGLKYPEEDARVLLEEFCSKNFHNGSASVPGIVFAGENCKIPSDLSGIFTRWDFENYIANCRKTSGFVETITASEFRKFQGGYFQFLVAAHSPVSISPLSKLPKEISVLIADMLFNPKE